MLNRRPIRRVRIPWVALLAIAAVSVIRAQPSPAEQLIERERVRAAVEDAFDVYYQRVDDGGIKIDNMMLAAERFTELGDAAVPYLATELLQNLPHNFVLCAFSLGRIGTPEAEAALREAIASADEEDSDWADTRKAWAAYALGLMGRIDVLESLNSGRHHVAAFQIHMDTTVLQLAALFTAPESIPVLHRQLRVYRDVDPAKDEAEEYWRDRMTWTEALGRLHDPSSLQEILAGLGDRDPAVRRVAAYALTGYGEPEAAAGLVRLVKEDSLAHVRYAAAWTLEQLLPSAHTQTFIELLDAEGDVHVRGVLYRLVARLAGDQALPALSRHLGRPEARDREQLLEAMRLLDAPARMAAFRAGLTDPAIKVVWQSSAGLAELGTPEAIDLLIAQIGSGNTTVVPLVASRLAEAGERRAGGAILSRLIDVELARPVTDPADRERIYVLGDALVALRHVDRMAALREAVTRQRDGFLVEYLHGLLTRLETLDRNGSRIEAWIATLDAPEAQLRSLAYARLAEIGGEEAARALAERFGRVDADEGVAILRQLGSLDTPSSRALIERVLVSPAFDPFDRSRLRDMAAWGARRLGGDAMIDTLERAARRRNGRDARVLVYLALTGGKRALPALDSLRVPRMRFLKWTNGLELDTLDKIAWNLRQGHSLAAFDLPPERLEFGRAGWVLNR